MSKGCREFKHYSVMLPEVLSALAVERGGIFVDCTMGGAGHASAILANMKRGTLLAIDRDKYAVTAGSERLAEVETQADYIVEHSAFEQLSKLLAAHGLSNIDGLIADLGVSSVQIDRPERGFSYRSSGPLDMRMDLGQSLTAADLVNNCSENELVDIFFTYGEERYARRIAANICRHRSQTPFATTNQLSEVIEKSLPSRSRREKHPSKRCFQALRIAVNSELQQLEELLRQIPDIAAPGARICFLTFHSLEDRIVKRAFKQWEHPCTCPKNMPCVCQAVPLGRILKRRGETATAAELEVNRRSHSARLRCFEFN